MKKLWITLLLIISLQAQTFEDFLETALKQSPYLQANRLTIERAQEEASLLQRYKNPILSLEASRFEADGLSSDGGYRVALAQPLRLWGVGDDREMLASATKQESREFFTLQRARFIQRLSLLYIDYKQAVALEELSREELGIAKKIESIAKERYQAGSSAKVKYLLAKLDTKRADNSYAQKALQRVTAYYDLLALSGVEEEPSLESRYEFKLLRTDSFQNSAELSYQEAQKQKALADAKLQGNKIEWVNLYMEYEKEPDQKITRLGLDIPLAVFNTKKEEKALARVQAKQNSLLLQNQKRLLFIALKRMEQELQQLQKLKSRTTELYNAQKEMLAMYEDGYKIANIKLIELQNLKSQMIETKEKAILLQSQIDTNIVNYNYNAGAYNEK
ncbi:MULTISPECIES: TolC family protein [Sulfurimonas]|uniref:TolC family protein n=1 Tax=Sulfurimonas TaxID=202746 RepID=UPI00126582B8|nr:TolC family protein [Sulfurimonas indica]